MALYVYYGVTGRFLLSEAKAEDLLNVRKHVACRACGCRAEGLKYKHDLSYLSPFFFKDTSPKQRSRRALAEIGFGFLVGQALRLVPLIC